MKYLASILMLLLVFHPAQAQSEFTTYINDSRITEGLPLYTEASDLQQVAQNHAQRMADAGSHFHNDNLEYEIAPGWAALGENVGHGSSIEALHNAFMDSPVHRANIMSTVFKEIGLGMVYTEDTVWVVQVFRLRRNTPPPPTSTSTTTATTTTTTLPPTTIPSHKPVILTTKQTTEPIMYEYKTITLPDLAVDVRGYHRFFCGLSLYNYL